MPSSDVLRRAAQLVAAGWTGDQSPANAQGETVPVFGGTTGDTARAGVNKAISAHTLYSAVVAAAHESRVEGPVLAAIWAALNEEIMQRMPHRPGGINHLHPVHAFNTAEDRAQGDVEALLNHVADQLDPSMPKDATADRLPPVTL